MTRFDNKFALVTGGISGIGAAIAQRLKTVGAGVITAQRGADTAYEHITAHFLNNATQDHFGPRVLLNPMWYSILQEISIASLPTSANQGKGCSLNL